MTVNPSNLQTQCMLSSCYIPITPCVDRCTCCKYNYAAASCCQLLFSRQDETLCTADQAWSCCNTPFERSCEVATQHQSCFTSEPKKRFLQTWSQRPRRLVRSGTVALEANAGKRLAPHSFEVLKPRPFFPSCRMQKAAGPRQAHLSRPSICG